MIHLQNAQRSVRIDVASLRAFAEHALPLCLKRARKGVIALTQFDVILVSDRRSAALHRRFMRIAGPTDVITFQHGEIFISVETARRNARRFQTSTENEIRLYLIHGLLHLLGFDDKKPAQARAMERAQARILRQASALVVGSR